MAGRGHALSGAIVSPVLWQEREDLRYDRYLTRGSGGLGLRRIFTEEVVERVMISRYRAGASEPRRGAGWLRTPEGGARMGDGGASEESAGKDEGAGFERGL